MESPLLHFAEHPLQEMALGLMATVYLIRIYWLTRFKAGKERQAATGDPGTTRGRGIRYSLMNVAMPWAMESTKKHFGFYVQFVLFHLGVVMGITLSFLIPYAPELMTIQPVVWAVQFCCGAAFLVALYRMYRRLTKPLLRSISTPDDYFSLGMLTVWFPLAVLAAPNSVADGELELLAFFFLTAFFLIYVPFSKIGHYLYYPFTRYYLGKSLGHRGVYPLKPSIKPAQGAASPVGLGKEMASEEG